MGLNEVFKKVADIESNATELASHKVDLTIVDDFNKEAGLSIQGVNAGNAIVSQASKLLQEAALKFKNTIATNERAIQMGNKILSDAKNIGIPAPNVIESTVKMLQVRAKDLQGAADRMSKAANGTYGINK